MKKLLAFLAVALLASCATAQPKQETPAAAPEASPADEMEGVVSVEVEAAPEAQAEEEAFSEAGDE